MTANKLAISLLGCFALASTGFAGTKTSGKACTSCCAPTPTENDLGVTAAIGYDSTYVFRGVSVADNWVTGSLDWTLPLTSSWNFNVGAIYGSSADDSFAGLGGVSYQRLELSAGVSTTINGIELGAGYRWYHHMGDGNLILEDGHEVGVTLATKAGPLNVGVGAYYDFAIEGWYFEAGVNSEIKLTESISLVPGVGIGYGADYTWHTPVSPGDGFTAVNVSLALPIKLTKSATLTPFIAWNLPIDALDNVGEDDQLHGGVSLSVKF